VKTMVIHKGDVWRDQTPVTITDYAKKRDMFVLESGGMISRACLLRRYTQEFKGAGKLLWSGPGAAPQPMGETK